MSSTQNSRAVPIRTIIMILVSAAIILAALGVHGVLTRNDDPQAALNAQEQKLKDAAAAQSAEPAAAIKVCIIRVDGKPTGAFEAKLGDKQKFELYAKGVDWPTKTVNGRRPPAAPDVNTVYFGTGQDDAANAVAKALEVEAIKDRPANLTACPADNVVVAVVSTE